MASTWVSYPARHDVAIDVPTGPQGAAHVRDNRGEDSLQIALLAAGTLCFQHQLEKVAGYTK
jgi:hypothetical protein